MARGRVTHPFGGQDDTPMARGGVTRPIATQDDTRWSADATPEAANNDQVSAEEAPEDTAESGAPPSEPPSELTSQAGSANMSDTDGADADDADALANHVESAANAGEEASADVDDASPAAAMKSVSEGHDASETHGANGAADSAPSASDASAAPVIPEAAPVEQAQSSTAAATDERGAASVSDERSRQAEFDRYYAVRAHLGPIAFSPDLTQVAYIVNISGQFNIWRQGVTGGWASQVTTFEDESVRTLLWTPNGDLIGAADHAGGEQYDIFSVPAQGGVVQYLTDNPEAQYELSEDGLSPDGRYLAFSGNDRNPTDADVLIRDLRTGETRRILANGHYNIAVNWSPDGRYLTVMDIRSNTDMRLWLVDTTTGEAYEALKEHEERYLAPGPWLPDSSGFYVITDQGREFKGIARFLLESRSLEWVLTPDWDVEQVALSADGKRLLWTLNESGRSQLHLRDSEQASLRVAGLPIGVIEYMKLSPDGETLVLRINSATAPAEVYLLTLGKVGALTTPHLRRLTFGMLGGLEPSDLVAPELVRYKTFDGREVPAWLYRPHGASQTNPAPLVISIHGGPEAQERVEYHALYQYLLARGIGVLAPNIRGSTGYGKTYQILIHRDWGGAELRDIEATAEYARALPWVDGKRLGVYGGSFGGFATLSAITRLPDYWAAAVDIVGPSNLLTFVRSVPPTWRRMMAAWVGDPEDDAQMLRERSPITHVEQARAPLLVLQGANDPRVVRAESDQMVETLRQRGRDVEYVVFEDEGHGFTKRVNLLRAYRLTANFFESRLKR